MRLAMAVPSKPKYGPLAVRPERVKSGPAVTAPARSGLAGSTPSLSTATVTPEPREVCHADVTPSLPSHHSCWRTESANAGALPSKIDADARPMAAPTIAGRGNLSGTPSLPSMVGSPVLCHAQAGYELPVAVLRSRRRPSGRVRDRQPDVRARRQPELLGGVTCADRQRDQPGAVGEGDDLAGSDGGERLQIRNGQLPAAAANDDRRAETDPQPPGGGGRDRELDVAEPVDRHHLALRLAVVHPARRRGQRHQLLDVDIGPGRAEIDARGQVGGHGHEDVPPVERR